MLNISKRTILLADSDVNYMRKMKEDLEKNIAVKVIGMVDNGEKALEKLEKEKPDMVLMDILLEEKDGLWLLGELNRKRINSVCFILSAIGADNIVRQAMSLGALYYMAKPVESDVLSERIMQIFAISQEIELEKEKTALQRQEEQKRNELENVISKLLNSMSITASIKGYHFIREGVVMVVENKGAILSMTKGLYPDIAKKYNTTAGKVERAMRHAIETAWKRTGKEVFSEMAGYCPVAKPTNSQFIAIMSEYIRVRNP